MRQTLNAPFLCVIPCVHTAGCACSRRVPASHRVEPAVTARHCPISWREALDRAGHRAASERIAQSQQAFAASSAPIRAVTCVELAKSYVASSAEHAAHEHRRNRRKRGEKSACEAGDGIATTKPVEV